MGNDANPIKILVADDDPDDRLLISEAFKESRLANQVDFVEDGIDLLDYLHRRNGYANLSDTDLPGVILLDLNMPRMGGREALEEIKKDSNLRLIPVVILTTSKAEEDVLRTYVMGASSFIAKPVTIAALVTIITALTKYWLQIVELPHRYRRNP